MVLKKFKLPGAPTMSDIFVEDGAGGSGGVEIIEPTYDSQTLDFTINKTMGEMLDLFKSGKTLIIKNTISDNPDVRIGSFVIYGANTFPGDYTLYSGMAYSNNTYNFEANDLDSNPVLRTVVI